MRPKLALLLTSLSTSCAIGTYHTATPLEKGKNEVGIAGGPSYMSKKPFMGSDASHDAISEEPASGGVLPHVELMYRRGMTSRTDLGVQVGTGTIRVDYNIGLVNTENFALSLNPQIDALFRLRIGLYTDVWKSKNGTLTLAISPGFSLYLGPLVSGGMLLKVPMGSFSALVFTDGEVIINPNVQTQIFVTGGLGLVYGF